MSKKTLLKFSASRRMEVKKLLVPLRMLRLEGMDALPKQNWPCFHTNTRHPWRRCIRWEPGAEARTEGQGFKIVGFPSILGGKSQWDWTSLQLTRPVIVTFRSSSTEMVARTRVFFMMDGAFCTVLFFITNSDSTGGVVIVVATVNFARILQGASAAA